MSPVTTLSAASTIEADELRQRLAALRVELTELAFALEHDGERVAADVATHAAGRVGEFTLPG